MKYVAYMAWVLLSYSTSGPNIFPQPAEVLPTEARGIVDCPLIGVLPSLAAGKKV
jgi:hypothetical protein